MGVRWSKAFKFPRWGVVRTGVTLIELMIVMAIIIIMTAIGVIALGRTDVNALQANALQVQALFERARQTALAQRTWTCVAVSPSNGRFTLYLQPTPATSSAGSPTFNASSQVLTLPSVMGLPSRFVGLTVTGEPLSAYFNNTSASSIPFVRKVDNITATGSNTIYLWFDGFGQPNVDSLPDPVSGQWPGGTAGNPSTRNYGFVNIATSNGSLVVQVVVYALTGVTGLIWVKR